MYLLWPIATPSEMVKAEHNPSDISAVPNLKRQELRGNVPNDELLRYDHLPQGYRASGYGHAARSSNTDKR